MQKKCSECQKLEERQGFLPSITLHQWNYMESHLSGIEGLACCK